jgi:hypothetical protein
MTTELVKQESNLPAELDGSWGSETISNDDILIPKLLLMQAMSQLVSEKEAAEAGDIIKSTTEEVVGGREKGVKIVPLMSFKTWTISEFTGSKFEFRSTEPLTMQNAAAALEWTDAASDGSGKTTTWRRDKGLNFYVLVKGDLEAAVNGNGACLPALISFRRTSMQAGKKLASGISESAMMKRPAASRVYELKSMKRKTDDHTYFVFDLVPTADKVSNEELTFAKQWYDTLKSSQVKVDDAADAE